LEEILRDIANRKFAPVYFLHGEESFFIDKIEETIEAHALTEAEKGFNQTLLYGKDVDHLTLMDYLRRYPMMSERQVVILREAQEMKGLGELIGYIDNPMPTTLFVVCFKHKKYDMSTKFGKALKAKAMVFEAKKLYDNQVADWISGYCRSQGMTIEPKAAALMAEYLGTELSKVANEIGKLALNLSKGTAINEKHIETYVGISKDFNVYELQKAIAGRDLQKLAMIRNYFEANIRKNPLIVTVSSLFSFFSKVYMLHFIKSSSDAEKVKTLDLRSDWFLKDYKLAANNYNLAQTRAILGLLRQYDLRSKGVETDLTSTGEEELMKELFWKMLNSPPN
jgi:DNA polymerase III subunit delta